MEFEHFVLTRFNVRTSREQPGIGCNSRWLSRRFELFEQFCYPSMRAQTVQEFRWLVFFDCSTPTDFVTRIEEIAASWKNFIPVFTDDMSVDTVRASIARQNAGGTPYLITTRLDNDDAVRVDFLEQVQEQFSGQDRVVVNFMNGLVWKNGRIYSHRDPSNAFASMIEANRGPLTVWCRQHPRLSEIAPILQIHGDPAWLQVIHGTNVSNRVRGKRCPVSQIRSQFGISSSVLPVRDSAFSYALDRYILDVTRAARESCLGVLRSARQLISGLRQQN